MSKKQTKKLVDVSPTPYDLLLTAVATGNLSLASEAIAAGANLSQKDPYGFSPLQGVVTNERISSNATCKLIELFVSHGADPNAKSDDGRSVIFLAAEFQQRKAAIETLLAAGADPNVLNSYGIHITENAKAQVVRKLLESVTGKKILQQKTVAKKERSLSSQQWAAARKKISKVFEKLESQQIMCMHKAGTTQDDGLADCSEEIQRRGGLKKSGIVGCCFYTGHDFKRCKDRGFLSLAFWAAPSGKTKDMRKVGELIVTTFRDSGFEVQWDGTADDRPAIWI